MNYLSSIILTVLLANALADTPPVRLPTNATVAAKSVVLQNYPDEGGKGRNSDGFIVGGSLAAQGEFPSFVLGGGCGGNLIHTDIVLTAAHCNGVFNGRVLVGAMVKGQTKKGAEWRNVTSQMVVHPQYNPWRGNNDYMVFKIEPSTHTPSQLNKDPAYPVANQDLETIGFGTTKESGPSSKFLRKVTVPYIDHATCKKLLGSPDEATELCAGLLAGGKDSCQGDSGGPIFDMNGLQVGVVSWGIGCARTNKPGVYSRISGGIDWINEQICTLSSSPPSWCSETTVPKATATPAPTAAPTDALPWVQVSVTVQYDAYPEELGWSLTDTTTGDKVVNYPAYTFFAPNKLLLGSVQLVEGRTYTLSMKDKYGDGFCCTNGNGYLEIKKGEDTLVSIWGSIGKSYSMSFVA